MSIITISRGSYSRGKEIAEKLASKLGYECISRDILLEASDDFNIPEIKLIGAIHDPISVLERFTYGKEKYISYIYSALLQHVRRDNVVYHGLAGHFFLRDIPHVLKVRVIADMQDRVNEEVKRENISAEKAHYNLMKDDEERRKWALQIYGMDTWDSRLYDIVLQIKRLTADDAVNILFDSAQKPNFQTTAESQNLIDDLALSAKVKANLARIDPKVRVTADNGKVYISKTSSKKESRLDSQIKKIASEIEGVKEVFFKEQHDHVNPFHNIE